MQLFIPSKTTYEDLKGADALLTLSGQLQSESYVDKNKNELPKKRRKKKTKRNIGFFPHEPDSKIAEKLGICRQTAWRRRMKTQALLMEISQKQLSNLIA